MSQYKEDRDEIITNWIIGFGILSGLIWLFAEYDFVELFNQVVKIFVME